MFKKIEPDWPRRELFHHYMDNLRCTYSLTVQIDVTRLRTLLRERGLRAYPAQIYMLAATVNRFPAFRMGLTDDGQPGYWEELHPAYTVFNRERETFSSVWTAYDPDFSRFYRSCARDLERYATAAEFLPQRDRPPNLLDISSVPWIEFTAFNLNVYSQGTHLLPIFTIGRYVEEDGSTRMPLALQLHHATCDGYHAGQFVQALRDMAADCESWVHPQ